MQVFITPTLQDFLLDNELAWVLQRFFETQPSLVNNPELRDCQFWKLKPHPNGGVLLTFERDSNDVIASWYDPKSDASVLAGKEHVLYYSAGGLCFIEER